MLQNLATPEQIQSGIPMTFSLEIRAPQNGQQSVEQTPVLAKYQVTYGSVLPQQIQEASQHASDQLSQLAQQEIQNQFSMQQQSRRSGSQSGSGWGQSQQMGERAAAGGSR